MTQELVLGVLLTGILGLLWVMTVAIWDGKHSSVQTQKSESAGHSDDMEQSESALKHHTVAA